MQLVLLLPSQEYPQPLGQHLQHSYPILVNFDSILPEDNKYNNYSIFWRIRRTRQTTGYVVRVGEHWMPEDQKITKYCNLYNPLHERIAIFCHPHFREWPTSIYTEGRSLSVQVDGSSQVQFLSTNWKNNQRHFKEHQAISAEIYEKDNKQIVDRGGGIDSPENDEHWGMEALAIVKLRFELDLRYVLRDRDFSIWALIPRFLWQLMILGTLLEISLSCSC